MNKIIFPFESDPNAQKQDLWELLPVRAFESECQRSLEMIELCQRYMAGLVADKEGADSQELRQSLADLETAAGRLDRNFGILSALLRCAQQAEQPQWEPVELCAFARTLCAEKDTIQQTLHICLNLDCSGLTELYVDADIGYLTTICLQLLSNALRACTPDGGHITLSVRARPEGGALLSIVDDGCGLPDGTLRGQQNNRSRFLGTTKSGLLLCQAYCRLTGWTLELTSRPDGPAPKPVSPCPSGKALPPPPPCGRFLRRIPCIRPASFGWPLLPSWAVSPAWRALVSRFRQNWLDTFIKKLYTEKVAGGSLLQISNRWNMGL